MPASIASPSACPSADWGMRFGQQKAPTARGTLAEKSRTRSFQLNKWIAPLQASLIDESTEHGPGVRLQKGKPAGKRK